MKTYRIEDMSDVRHHFRVEGNNGLCLDIRVVEQDDWYDALVIDIRGIILEGERKGYFNPDLPNKSFWIDQPYDMDKFIRALLEIDLED